MVCEYDAAGAVKKKYVYALGKCIAEVDEAGNKTFNTHDAQGSVRLITNMSQQVVKTYAYYPFGDSLSYTGTAANDLRYTEQRYVDGMDCYDYNARYYDQKLGRFYGMDPIFSPGISPYAYCGNDPVSFTDPSGMARQVACTWADFWGTVEAGRAGMICGSWGGAGSMYGPMGFLAKNPDAKLMVYVNNYISDRMMEAARNDYWHREFEYTKSKENQPLATFKVIIERFFNVIEMDFETLGEAQYFYDPVAVCDEYAIDMDKISDDPSFGQPLCEEIEYLVRGNASKAHESRDEFERRVDESDPFGVRRYLHRRKKKK